VGVSGQYHAMAAILLGKNPGTHQVGDGVDTKAGLDTLEKRKISSLIGIWTPDHSV
jgi:hypothetical protein